MREHGISLQELCPSVGVNDRGVGRQLVICPKQRAYEHEHSPYRYREEDSDEGCLLGLVVVLGCQVTLDNGLIGAIFLQSIKDAIEDHYPECRFDKVPIIRTHVNLSCCPCCAYNLAWSIGCTHTKEKESDTKQATADEQESLYNIHPDDGLHATQECQDNDSQGQYGYDEVDVEIHEGSQCHRNQIEHRTHLGEMRQDESHRTIIAGSGPEATLEILVGR